jgi:hypothetical protein
VWLCLHKHLPDSILNRGCQTFLDTIYQIGKIYQMTRKYTKWTETIPNSFKIDQIAIEYTNSFHCKTLQNLPNLGFLVWKYSIWQPCCKRDENSFCISASKRFQFFGPPDFSASFYSNLETRFNLNLWFGALWIWTINHSEKHYTSACLPERERTREREIEWVSEGGGMGWNGVN